MKNTIKISCLLFANLSLAQVAIGKSSISLLPTPPNPANTINSFISLEFGDYVANQGKGIVLPWITTEMDKSTAVPGTIIYDSVDKIVKYKNGPGVNNWFPLSKNETVTVNGIPNFDTTGVVNTTLQNSLSDAPAAKTSIGTPSSIPGILVLEDNNKAMVLPKVPSPHLNIANPEPGTMAYDTVTKQLAVYNGKVWSFWKP